METSISLNVPSSASSGESFTADCEVENKANNTVFYSSKVAFSGSGGLTKSSGNDKNSRNIAYKESVSGSSKFKASGSGSQEVTCKLENENGISVSKKASISIESKDTGGNGDGGGDDTGGGGFVGSTGSEDEFDSYMTNYSFSNISRNNELLKIAGNLTERDYKTNSSCFEGYRKVENRSSKISVNYSCNESDILLIDRIPEGTVIEKNYSEIENKIGMIFSNLENDTFRVNYSNHTNEFNWNMPVPLKLSEKEEKNISELSIDITYKEFNKTEKEAYLGFRLNRKADCRISNGPETKTLSNVTDGREKVGLETGNNTVELQCGEKEREFSVNVAGSTSSKTVDEEDDSIGIIPLLKAGGVLTLLVILIELVIHGHPKAMEKARVWMARYYKGKFFSSVQAQDHTNALEKYEKLEEHTDGDADIGIYLYLSLEALQDAKDKDLELDKKDKLLNTVEDYLEDNPDDTLSEDIKEKFEEIQA